LPERERSVSGATRRPAALLIACALGALLGVDALVRAHELKLLGAFDLAMNAQGALLVLAALGVAWRPRAWLALAQAALALWVYAGLAPIVGDLAANGFANVRLWLRPLPLAAFSFFPLAFFGWRALARENAARSGDALR
jgi:hypothetical protein